jgi:hypothetical protein
LICVRGSTTGKLNWADQRYCLGRGLAAISTFQDLVVIKFIFYHLLNSKEEIMRHTTGTTFPNLQSSELHSITFPLAPYAEQEKIAKKIEKSFSILKENEEILKGFDKKADIIEDMVSMRAFSGQLVVCNENEQSASTLLQNISNEAKKQPFKKRKSIEKIKQSQSKKQRLGIYAFLIENGETQIEQVLETTGKNISDFWDELEKELDSGRIEQLKKGKRVTLKVKI